MITLTETAANHIKKSLASRGKGLGIRFGVKSSGCSGFSYMLEFVDELSEGDKVFESYGAKVIVDYTSMLYVDGTELDYIREGLQEGFSYSNPNQKSACGCGESFTV